jgi:hypothetical protein
MRPPRVGFSFNSDEGGADSVLFWPETSLDLSFAEFSTTAVVLRHPK